jgi:hypothetical protein
MDERAFIQLEVRDFGGDSVCFQYILHVFSRDKNVRWDYTGQTFPSRLSSFLCEYLRRRSCWVFASAAVRFRVSVHRIVQNNII